jgi:uncharacterized protein with HEPN domain
MSPSAEADPLYLDLILERIGRIRESIAGADYERFSADRDLSDVTAFRLANIGETAGKLSRGLKARHPAIPRNRLSRLRNIVVHAYPTIDTAVIWNVATTQLDELLAACREELDRLDGST